MDEHGRTSKSGKHKSGRVVSLCGGRPPRAKVRSSVAAKAAQNTNLNMFHVEALAR